MFRETTRRKSKGTCGGNCGCKGGKSGSLNVDKNKLKDYILVLTFGLMCSILILVSYMRFCK